jgi:hypothetical protein
MKIELFRGGKLYMTIEATGDMASDDLVILPKSITEGSCLSKQSFEELFYRCVKESHTYREAYEKAEEIHEHYFGRRRYTGDSFLNLKNRK